MSSNNEILNLMTVKVPMIMNKETLKIKIIIIILIKIIIIILIKIIIIILIKKVIITILKINYRISPYIISTISSKQVMKIQKNI